MKLTKALLGKYVEVEWRDTIGVQRAPLDRAPKGFIALARWKERGVLDDITDGVARIVHSAGFEPGSENIDEISYTSVEEAVIVSIVVLEPVRNGETA